MTEFTVTWEVDDGYAGGARPHHTRVSLSEFEEDMTENEIAMELSEIVNEDFSHSIAWHSIDIDAVAREILAALKERGEQ